MSERSRWGREELAGELAVGWCVTNEDVKFLGCAQQLAPVVLGEFIAKSKERMMRTRVHLNLCKYMKT